MTGSEKRMIETLQSIILDFQEAPLETGVPRHLQIETIQGKATVLIGVRRTGKSTYLNQIIQRLLDNGVPRENLLYVNFFDDRLHNLCDNNLSLIPEAYYTLYPEKKNTEQVSCFFDEIQAVTGWEPFLERLIQTEKCAVYPTGSSSIGRSRWTAARARPSVCRRGERNRASVAGENVN
jgi:predicted AAA+ superfamily ATPase